MEAEYSGSVRCSFLDCMVFQIYIIQWSLRRLRWVWVGPAISRPSVDGGSPVTMPGEAKVSDL